MKLFKFLPILCVLASFQSYGMESEHKETYNPKHQRSMPSANDELKLPEVMEELVISNRALEHHSDDESKNTVMEVDTATAAQNPLQQLVVYDEKYKADVHKFLYDELATHKENPVLIPKELVQLILGYLPFHEFKGEHVISLNGKNAIELSNGLIAYVQGNNKVVLWNPNINEQGRVIITMHLEGEMDEIDIIELSDGTLACTTRTTMVLVNPKTGDIKGSISYAPSTRIIVQELSENVLLLLISSVNFYTPYLMLLYNVDTQKIIQIPNDAIVPAISHIQRINKHLIAIVYNKTVQICDWNPKNKQFNGLETLNFSDDIKQFGMLERNGFAVGGSNGIPCLFEACTQQPTERKMNNYNKDIINLDEKLFASFKSGFNFPSDDSGVKFWDSSTYHHQPQLLKNFSFKDLKEEIRDVIVLQSKLLVIASYHYGKIYYSAVRIVNPKTGEIKKEIKLKKQTVLGLRELLNGCLLLKTVHTMHRISQDTLQIWR